MSFFTRRKILSQKITPGSGTDPADRARITVLEDNEYKITYYEIVSGTSGTITLPTGATINEGEFGLSGNAVLSRLNGSDKPTFKTPLTAGGVAVTTSLDVITGDWISSGTYTDATVALIYSLKINGLNYHNLDYDFIIETAEVDTISGSIGETAGVIPFGTGVANTVTSDHNFSYAGGILNVAEIDGFGQAILRSSPSSITYFDLQDGVTAYLQLDDANYQNITTSGFEINSQSYSIGSADFIQLLATTDITLSSYSGVIRATSGASKDIIVQTGTTGVLNLDSGTTGVVKLGTGAFAKTITIGNVTGATSVNINSGTASAGWTTTNGRWNLITGTGQINIGADAFGKPIVIGNSTVATSVAISVGTTFTLDGAVGSTYSIGASLTTGTINIGGTGLQTGTITIGGGTGAQTLNFGTGGTGAKTINIGSSAAGTITIGNTTVAQTIGIAAGTGGSTVNIHNAANTGSVNIGGNFTTGTITFGSTSQSGIITLGRNAQSSGTSTINIGAGATTSTHVQTINIGTSGVRKDINIGTTNTSSVNVWNFGSAGVKLNGTTSYFNIGELVGSASYGAIYINKATPSNTNYSFLGNTISSEVNGVSNVYISMGGVPKCYFTASQTSISQPTYFGDFNTPAVARVEIAPSLAIRAHLRLFAGVAPTTPNDGDIWYDGTNMKMRIAGVTKTFTLV